MDTTTDYAAYDVEDAEVAPKHATIATGTDSRGRLDAELDAEPVAEPVAEPASSTAPEPARHTVTTRKRSARRAQSG
jgi:hypothetical protein